MSLKVARFAPPVSHFDLDQLPKPILMLLPAALTLFEEDTALLMTFVNAMLLAASRVRAAAPTTERPATSRPTPPPLKTLRAASAILKAMPRKKPQ